MQNQIDSLIGSSAITAICFMFNTVYTCLRILCKLMHKLKQRVSAICVFVFGGRKHLLKTLA